MNDKLKNGNRFVPQRSSHFDLCLINCARFLLTGHV
jgi:hypothetical protein